MWPHVNIKAFYVLCSFCVVVFVISGKAYGGIRRHLNTRERTLGASEVTSSRCYAF